MSATGALGSFLFGFRALGGARREWVGGWGSRKMAALLERKTAQGEERTCCFVPPPPSTVCMAQALEGRPNMPPSLAQQEPSSSDAKNSVSELLGALYAHTALRSTPGRVGV